MSGDETAAQRPVDVGELRRRALAAARGAYRPYSGLGVGAAAVAVPPVRNSAERRIDEPGAAPAAGPGDEQEKDPRVFDDDDGAARPDGAAEVPAPARGWRASAATPAPDLTASGAAPISATPPAGDAEVRIVTGCNVENASYGLTLCAECSLVSDLFRTGGGRLLELVVVAHTGEPLAPCGRCRQLLHEHGGPDLIVHGARGPVRLGELLPDAFGPGDLT